MKKFISAVSVCALTLSLLSPFPGISAGAETIDSWNTARYGDRIDMDSRLDTLSKDASYLELAEQKVKEAAAKAGLDEDAASDSENTGDFTYDGGTKFFLNYELDFKEFTLRSDGQYVEIWVADDLAFGEGDTRPAPVVTQAQVDQLRDEFDSNIYQKATSFFGFPEALDGSNSPLIDWGYFPEGYYNGDKLIILVDNIRDEQYYDQTYPFFVAGFFWQTIESYIDRNIITIDTKDWATRLENTYYGTTIHELQHLIHADNDPAEESWINEGMSTFSEYLGGYGHDDKSINFYLDHPENSLVYWDDHVDAVTGPETIADYGQVYLFTLYMNDKFGQEFIRDLALNQKQGIDSVNDVLLSHNCGVDFTKLYQNFITALVLDSDKPGNGIYNFDSINLRDLVVDNAGTKRGYTVDFEKALSIEKEGVPAWGGDFKELNFQDKIRSIAFDGVDFLPTPWEPAEDPLGSGETVLWGNAGDEADNMLIFEADLTGTEQAILSFDNYIQIEEQWDFGFVQVSTDDGLTWTSLSNDNVRSDLVEEGYPKIRENLPGFTGYYDNWRKESFDLTDYAGQKILVAFRYMTDWGENMSGWYIDNIEIPEVGFYDDCSSTEGFISIDELLGQYVNYTVTFINEKVNGKGNGQKTNYKVITVDPFNVSQEDALTLKQLFKDGRNYMITTFAAPADVKTPADFTYEIRLKETGPKTKNIKSTVKNQQVKGTSNGKNK